MAIGLPSEGVDRATHNHAAGLSPRLEATIANASVTAGEAVVGRLESREWLRRLWHMLPGLAVVPLFFVPHRDPISPTLWWIVMGIGLGLALQILLGFRKIVRRHETGGTAAVAGYVFSVLGMVLLFPAHLEMALAVLAILAFGDGSATLFGLLIRGPKLPWNPAKSWSGFAAFLTIGTLTASFYYHAETLNPEAANPATGWPLAVMIIAPAVLAAALAESIQSRINDNIRVGVVASAVISGIHFLLLA